MIRSRIAPTPSGFLHKGNAFNFWLISRLIPRQQGTLILRIDDIDYRRVKNEYVEDIFEALNWLGMKWDEGPSQVSEVKKYSQLNFINEYFGYISQLKNNGYLFACECTRSMLANTVQYPGTCLHKNLPFSDDMSWRLITRREPVVLYDTFDKREHTVNLYETMPYPVIKKRDGYPAYQIASLADDVRMNINVIVRGKDLLDSTATQLYLAELLNLPSFGQVKFYHHDVLVDYAGKKLSKSASSFSIKEYRKTHTLTDLHGEFERIVESLK